MKSKLQKSIFRRCSALDLLIWLQILAIPGCILTLLNLKLEYIFLRMIVCVPGVPQNILLVFASIGLGLILAMLDEKLSVKLYCLINTYTTSTWRGVSIINRINLACTLINIIRFCLVAIAEEFMRLTFTILLVQYMIHNMLISAVIIGFALGLSYIAYGLHVTVPKTILHVVLSLIMAYLGLLYAIFTHIVFNVYVLCFRIKIEREVCRTGE